MLKIASHIIFPGQVLFFLTVDLKGYEHSVSLHRQLNDLGRPVQELRIIIYDLLTVTIGFISWFGGV